MSRLRCADCKKWAHESEADALVAALDSSAAYGLPFRTYRCPINTEWWHLTSKPDTRRQTREATS